MVDHYIFVELAIHANTMEHFKNNPLSDKQVIDESVMEDYSILSFETSDYIKLIPVIQSFLPYIKVMAPLELDIKIRENIKNYDTNDLSKFL